MSCGMPCWNCSHPIPPQRHNLNAMRRVFCSEECEDRFKDPPGRHRIYISHKVGWCPAGGKPILDSGYDDDPAKWEHAWT